jgi:hypothetical protein
MTAAPKAESGDQSAGLIRAAALKAGRCSFAKQRSAHAAGQVPLGSPADCRVSGQFGSLAVSLRPLLLDHLGSQLGFYARC